MAACRLASSPLSFRHAQPRRPTRWPADGSRRVVVRLPRRASWPGHGPRRPGYGVGWSSRAADVHRCARHFVASLAGSPAENRCHSFLDSPQNGAPRGRATSVSYDRQPDALVRGARMGATSPRINLLKALEAQPYSTVEAAADYVGDALGSPLTPVVTWCGHVLAPVWLAVSNPRVRQRCVRPASVTTITTWCAGSLARSPTSTVSSVRRPASSRPIPLVSRSTTPKWSSVVSARNAVPALRFP